MSSARAMSPGGIDGPGASLAGRLNNGRLDDGL